MRLGGIFDVDAKRERLEEVVRELESTHIWNNPEQAQVMGRERVALESVVHHLDNLTQHLRDLHELFELARMEEDDAAIKYIGDELIVIEKQVAELEFRKMFSGQMDDSNAWLDIQSGSGGTEAQDWAEMLLRMYLRWGESHGFTPDLVECSAGDVAGLTREKIEQIIADEKVTD